MRNKIKKPTIPQTRSFTPSEIKYIRKWLGFKITQGKFARYFPVTLATIKAWEGGHRTPYGPSSARLQDLYDYAVQEEEGKRKALQRSLNRRKK